MRQARAKGTSKPDPWQSKEERRQEAARLERMLHFAEQNEDPEEEIEDIKGKLKAATKLIERQQPPGVMLENTMKYLERAKTVSRRPMLQSSRPRQPWRRPNETWQRRRRS